MIIDNISTRLTYLLIGGGIGAVIALLFAPKSGQELRGDIADATRKGIDKSREAAQQLGERAGEYYEATRERAGELYTQQPARLLIFIRRPLRKSAKWRRQRARLQLAKPALSQRHRRRQEGLSGREAQN